LKKVDIRVLEVHKLPQISKATLAI